MTFKTTVVDENGRPIPNAYVQANVEETGASYTRFTDGQGYADVAILQPFPENAHLTFVVQADGYRISPQYFLLTPGSADVQIGVRLSPFVSTAL